MNKRCVVVADGCLSSSSSSSSSASSYNNSRLLPSRVAGVAASPSLSSPPPPLPICPCAAPLLFKSPEEEEEEEEEDFYAPGVGRKNNMSNEMWRVSFVRRALPPWWTRCRVCSQRRRLEPGRRRRFATTALVPITRRLIDNHGWPGKETHILPPPANPTPCALHNNSTHKPGRPHT